MQTLPIVLTLSQFRALHDALSIIHHIVNLFKGSNLPYTPQYFSDSGAFPATAKVLKRLFVAPQLFFSLSL